MSPTRSSSRACGRSTASRRRPRRSRAPRSSIRGARRPLIVAGGGVIYSEATAALRGFVEATGIPVGETQAGPRCAGLRPPAQRWARSAPPARSAANRLAREADLVIGIGTRWSDFTTASKSAFQDPGVRFVNVNVAAFDAGKHAGLPLVADARVALDRSCARRSPGWRVTPAWAAARRRGIGRLGRRGRSRARSRRRPTPPSQAAIIGAINDAAGRPASSSAPPARRPATCTSCGVRAIPTGKGYHVEYGYSCMGYEIPGGIGRQARRARARGVRVGRRRLLPDAARASS